MNKPRPPFHVYAWPNREPETQMLLRAEDAEHAAAEFAFLCVTFDAHCEEKEFDVFVVDLLYGEHSHFVARCDSTSGDFIEQPVIALFAADDESRGDPLVIYGQNDWMGTERIW